MSTILDSLKKSSDQRNDQKHDSIDNFNFGSSNKKSKKAKALFYLLTFIIILAVLYYGYEYYINMNEHDDVELSQEFLATNDEKLQNPLPKKEQSLKLEQQQSNLKKKAKPNAKKVKKDVQERMRVLRERKEKEKESLQKLNSPSHGKELSKKEKQGVKKEPMIKLEMPKTKTRKLQQSRKKPEVKKEPHKQPTHNYKYIYQLPFSMRKEIPKLKINIHVYDENPESRLVVINGVRFQIDDMIEELVLVKEIIKEGVVLEFNDQEFLVPKL